MHLTAQSLGSLPERPPSPPRGTPLTFSRRRFLRLCAGAAGASALTGLYAWQVEPHWLEIVRRPLPIENLPDALMGRTLLQISDLHTGGRVSDSYLIDSLDRASALAPDIVAFTGDLISHHGDTWNHLKRTGPHLPRGRIATVGSLGNHDYGLGWSHPEDADRVTEALSGHGMRVLRNEVAEIEGMQFIGLDDLWARRFEPESVLPKLDPTRAMLAMSHNPDTVDLPGWDNFRGWILSGHTHGGQCRPPFLPPPILPVVNKRYTSGEFELSNHRRMYISRGVGHLWQVRFNVRPEITLFTLTRVAVERGPK